jgi:hypothetical protein
VDFWIAPVAILVIVGLLCRACVLHTAEPYVAKTEAGFLETPKRGLVYPEAAARRPSARVAQMIAHTSQRQYCTPGDAPLISIGQADPTRSHAGHTWTAARTRGACASFGDMAFAPPLW